MDHLIIPRGAWRISPQSFRRSLLSRWPDATLREVRTTERRAIFEYELPMSHSRVYGDLDRRGRYVSFSGDIRDMAEFALWFRSLVPESEQLLFSDEGMNSSLDLKPDTTLGEIFSLAGYTPPQEAG